MELEGDGTKHQNKIVRLLFLVYTDFGTNALNHLLFPLKIFRVRMFIEVSNAITLVKML